MKKIYRKISIILALIFELILVISLITSIQQKNTRNIGLSLMAIILFIMPFIISKIAKKKLLHLPTSFNTLTILFLFLAIYLGEINNFYIKYPWWDLMLHFIFGMYSVIFFVHIVKDNIKGNKISQSRFAKFIVLFGFNFSASLATLWELFEFSGDFLFKTGMVKGGLQDTCTDLLVNLGAASATSLFYYYKYKKTTS